MIVLGVLLILAAGGATAFAVMAPSGTSETIVVTALGVKVSASPLAMFLAGAVSVALLGFAYILISRGTRRKARSRKELRQLRKEQAASGASASSEGGHRSTRHDRQEKDGHVSSAATTDVNSQTDTKADSTGAMTSDRHQEAEPPSPS